MATIPLAFYMWSRIREVGIESIMGLPGDFNLNFLDHIYDVPGLRWVGNSNELNSAYAADGYARIKGTAGCIVTTHGVGEMSALNGIAGSASECIPVIHIVGQTSKMLQDNHLMIHHSIGFKPDHQQYNKASLPIRAAAAELWDPKDAPAEIDRVIRECFVKKKPVYIFFPIDLTNEKVPASLLDKKIDLSYPVNKENEDGAVEGIMQAFQNSTKPAGVCGSPRAPQMSKGLVDEDKPYYVGLYAGKVSYPGIQEAADAHDFVLSIGWFPCDTNTSFFSRNWPVEQRVDILDDHVIIKGKRLENVYMQPLLARLNQMKLKVPEAGSYQVPKGGSRPTVKDQDPEQITQAWLWPRLSDYLKPNDIIVGETGTTGFGLADTIYKPNTKYICQTYYGSIGYSLPCSLGAHLAARELHASDPDAYPERRTVLIVGDGSAQLTVQEVGTMVHNKAKILIILINNDGYTIERAIHGAHQQYNDISPYNWSHMLPFFGVNSETSSSSSYYHLATTKSSLESILSKPEIQNPQGMIMVEIKMDKLDIPWRLAQTLQKRDPEMGRMLEKEGFTNLD